MRQKPVAATSLRLPARHVRDAPGPARAEARPIVQPRPQPQPQPSTVAAPTTLSLVISRRARREAVEAAVAGATVDPRVQRIEQVLTGFQLSACALVLGLSGAGWLWLSHQSRAPGQGGAVATEASSDGLVETLQPLIGLSGATLALVMLMASLLMAPVVNPFYVAPNERRWLHALTTSVFVLLAVTTVAVIANAAR